MRIRLPTPATWQDFEALCHQLWKEIWSDPNAQPNGRSGQAQSGVDIWGRPIYSVDVAGVQCKDKNGLLGSKLTEKELFAECLKATAFKPKLRAFTMATTSPRDAHIQNAARALNGSKKYPFEVHVWSWDDIEAEVACRPALVGAFYRGVPEQALDNAVKIAPSAPRDQFLAFFGRPSLVNQLGSVVRDSLIQLGYELCDNAFLHGKATQVRLEFDGVTLRITDDGTAFDPLSGMDAAKASMHGHLGSFVFRSFLDRYSGQIKINYTREQRENGTGDNILSIHIGEAARFEQTPEVLDLSVDLSAMFSRRSAAGLAQSLSIPVGVKELVITVGNTCIISGASEFIRHLRARLPESTSLTISHPRGHLLSEISFMFDPTKVKFQSR